MAPLYSASDVGLSLGYTASDLGIRGEPMHSLHRDPQPLYRSKSLEKIANDDKYTPRWPYEQYRNWSLYDDYWYDCYMGTSPRSRIDKAPYSMWNYPYSSWIRHRNFLYDLPSIYPSYYSKHYYRYNDNARYLYYRNYFTYYSPLNRHWLTTTNKYANYY